MSPLPVAVESDAMRLAAVSVDLDGIELYEAVHGLVRGTAEAGGHESVYLVAIARLADWASALGIPLTWFVVGRDASRKAVEPVLEALVRRGDELGNHSFDHHYDLTRRGQHAMLDQICRTQTEIERASGVRPVGFRAPGYTVNDVLLETLREVGLRYDSSVFPCPPYYVAKAAVLGLQRIRGRRSFSILDSPRVLWAPTAPYRIGMPYTRRGGGLLEIPIQVTRGLRLPFIGTTLALAGPALAARLAKSLVGEAFVNLELHALDALDASDGLEALAAYQPDLRRSSARKLEAFSAALGELKRAGYGFVTLAEASTWFPG